jgi:hypothetical protein
MTSLDELLLTKRINRSDFNSIMSAIISGKGHPLLVEYGSQTNLYHTFTDQVDKKIAKLINENTETKPIRKLLYGSIEESIGRTSNITTWVVFNCRDQNTINFGILGSDIKPFIHNLPKYIDNKTRRVCSPYTLSDYTKVYPSFLRKLIIAITTNLMLLDNLFKINNIVVTNDFTEKTTGHLGGEVIINIPTELLHLTEYFNEQSLSHQNNPQKVSEGRFNFNKNGLTHSIANKLIGEIHTYLNKLDNPLTKQNASKLYESYIVSYDISDFIQSDKEIAVCGWNRHSRVIVKSKTNPNEIIVIDPWMKYIPRSLVPELQNANPTITFTMLQRSIKDQLNGEGSCVLCSMSRLLMIVSEYEDDGLLLEICNKPISDINAFLIGKFYRIATGQSN